MTGRAASEPLVAGTVFMRESRMRIGPFWFAGLAYLLTICSHCNPSKSLKPSNLVKLQYFGGRNFNLVIRKLTSGELRLKLNRKLSRSGGRVGRWVFVPVCACEEELLGPRKVWSAFVGPWVRICDGRELLGPRKVLSAFAGTRGSNM